MKCPSGFKLINEGLAKVCIPDPDLYRRSDGVFEPAWAPVFYNPAMVTNRDSAIVVLNALRRSVSLAVDAMAGTGVRGIRMLLECPYVERVIMNDIDEKCISVIRINAEINGVIDRSEILNRDCNELLYSLIRERRRPQYIDIDPFGSPAPYILSAVSSISRGGVIGVTATDLAPLEGKYPRKLYRRYGVYGSRVEVSKSIAIRNLLAFIAREAAKVDRVVKPLMGYWCRHYVRIYVVVDSGGLKASEVLEKCVGVIAYCNNCGYREILMRSAEDRDVIMCPVCGREMSVVRGTWICRINDPDFVQQCLEAARSRSSISNEFRNIIENVWHCSVMGDPLPIKTSSISRFLKRNMPKISKLIDTLREKGFRAYRVRGLHDEIVTDAPYEEVLSIMKTL